MKLYLSILGNSPALDLQWNSKKNNRIDEHSFVKNVMNLSVACLCCFTFLLVPLNYK
jgi:hypothetical protein